MNRIPESQSGLIAALALALAPQALRLPPWVLLWCLALWSWFWFRVRTGGPLPGPGVRTVLFLVGLAAVLATYRFQPGGQAFVAVLAVMAGLKPLEIRTYRDRMVTVFLAYFLVITSLFVFENLAITGYLFFSVLVTTTVLIGQHSPASPMKANLKTALVIMGQALPLMLVLYAVFPRSEAAYWGLVQRRTGVSGFSSRLQPGSVAQLIRSDRIAFRARFDGSRPPADQLYWRGVVFTRFDGRSWYRTTHLPLGRNTFRKGNRVGQVINLEPQAERWLFALDQPVTAPPGTRLLQDYTLRSNFRIRRKRTYRVASLPTPRSSRSPPPGGQTLQLPRTGNPEARRLALKWKQSSRDPREIVATALRFYRESGFRYSLSSPVWKDDGMDRFLFQSRAGFCEHFAGSFAFLMRAAGVPARIVGGFLGGDYNPYGNYVIVRQSHAHTWVEVWQAEGGWQRVDPTAAVTPRRLADGADSRLLISADSRTEGSRLPVDFESLIERLAYRWDQLNTFWDFRLMGYSREDQSDLLSRLGWNAGAWRTTAAATIATLLLLGGYALYLRRRKGRRPSDPVQGAYLRFCKKLSDAGIPREASQGPAAFAGQVVGERTALRRPVEDIVGQYIDLRYRSRKNPRAEKRFIRSVRRFRPDRYR